MERRRLERPTSSLQSWQPPSITTDPTGTCEHTPDNHRHYADSCGQNGPASEPVDPQLARLVAAWPDLPEPIRRAMLAMVEAGGNGGEA